MNHQRRLVRALVLFVLVGAVLVGAAAQIKTKGGKIQSLEHRAVRKIRITGDDIARLPGRQNYLVDLTRPGVIYELDSTLRRIDFTRVKVHTAAGDFAMETWLKRQLPGTAGSRWRSERLRIGHAKDLIGFVAAKAGQTPSTGSTGFSCDGGLCKCEGDADCNALFSSGRCGDVAACNPDGCSCLEK